MNCKLGQIANTRAVGKKRNVKSSQRGALTVKSGGLKHTNDVTNV